MNTDRRFFQRIAVVCVIAGVIYWVAHLARPMSDSEWFQTMQSAGLSFSKAVSEERGHWGEVLRLFHYSRHYLKIYKSEREALLASGYLTNLTFKIPEDATEQNEWFRREAVLIRDTNVQIVLPIMTTEKGETITCRMQDVRELHQVLGK
jgi:hypothetical protein